MKRTISPLPRFALARLALSVCLLALFGVGCVVPLPVEEEEPDPNFPPFYDPLAVDPGFDQVVSFDPQGADEATLNFNVSVVGDYNTDETLFWRLYLNYDPQTFPIRINGDEVRQTGSVFREPIQFSLDCSNFSPFREVDLHRLELVIGDRAFEDSNSPALLEGAEQTRVVWFIELVSACRL
ncbi:MAG: hypothetical protein ACE366_05550 [Bradymonadia bacterium]